MNKNQFFDKIVYDTVYNLIDKDKKKVYNNI